MKPLKPTLIKPLTESQQACVDLLADALEQAKGGHISSVAIVVDMATGFGTGMAGANAARLNLGCDSLKRKLLSAVEDENPKSFIMRAQ